MSNVTFIVRKRRWIWGGGYDIHMDIGKGQPKWVGRTRNKSHAQVLAAFLTAIPDEVHLLPESDQPKVSIRHIDEDAQDEPRTVH